MVVARFEIWSGNSGGLGVGRGPRPPVFLDQTEARRAEKKFLETTPPLSQGLGDPPPPSPLPLSEGLDPPLGK